MSLSRISIGRLFHNRGPAARKLLSSICDCIRGTVHVWTSDDLRCRRPTSVTSWQFSDMFVGAKPCRDLYTITASLNLILCFTGSQWSCLSTGVMWSRRRAPVTSRTDCVFSYRPSLLSFNLCQFLRIVIYKLIIVFTKERVCVFCMRVCLHVLLICYCVILVQLLVK